MKKTYTLKRELTLLMILTSVCTLLSVCAAVFYVFFSFFFPKLNSAIIIPPLNNDILNCVKEITYKDDADGTDGNKDAQQFRLNSLAKHNHGW